MRMREFVGKVTKTPFAVGSKSERNVVRLETDAGSYVLRRAGGNAFKDPELDKLVGKTIRCKGEAEGYTLVINEWTEQPAE